eukprot:472337_1
MGKTRQPKGHAPSAQTRTKKQKRKDIEKAIKLQDRKYTYFMGTKKKATVVSQKILKKAIIQNLCTERKGKERTNFVLGRKNISNNQ